MLADANPSGDSRQQLPGFPIRTVVAVSESPLADSEFVGSRRLSGDASSRLLASSSPPGPMIRFPSCRKRHFR